MTANTQSFTDPGYALRFDVNDVVDRDAGWPADVNWLGPVVHLRRAQGDQSRFRSSAVGGVAGLAYRGAAGFQAGDRHPEW